MRTIFDQLAKQVLSELLEPSGPVQTELEVSSEVQTADVCFVPDPARRSRLDHLGLLGRLAGQPCLFEPYSRTPGTHEVLSCHGKLYAWYQSLCRKGAGTVTLPALWILSPGVPETVLAEFELRPASPGPEAVYRSAPGFGLGVVVLSQLPAGRETLSLRLMGRGEVQRHAIAELHALPADAWERLPLLDILSRLRFELPAAQQLSAEEEEFLMNVKQSFEEFKTALIEQGLQEGKQEGRQEGLKSSLLIVYQARFGPVPDGVRQRVDATEDLELLRRWLALAASAPVEEVQRAVTGDGTP